MQYYLKHYFDPDFDYRSLKPGNVDGAADVYSLGYVQNVIEGQVLAEIMTVEASSPEHDPRFLFDHPVLPVGANTRIDPKHPNYLLASVNGYVFYHEGKITVKNLLNVRQDVSFQTGNIFFVGDMAVHGSVRAGFSVQGNNVRIMGMLEGGIARASGNLMVDGGARGGAGQHSKLDAGGNLLAQFLEKVEARSRGTMVVEKSCLYSTVYAGGNMIVRDKTYGGVINAYGCVYVGTQLGNKASVPTRVYLGYDPMSLRQLEKIDQIITRQSQAITHLAAIAGHLPPDANQNAQKLQEMRTQRALLIKRRDQLWNRLYLDENYMRECRLLCPGLVYPGVEIAIGRAFHTVDACYEQVAFRLGDDEVVMEPIGGQCCSGLMK